MLLAHGVGSRGDLPLPLWMFTWAAALALVASFVALGVLWTRPQLAQAARGRALISWSGHRPPPALQSLLWSGRGAALALFAVALWAGLFGDNDSSRNLLPVTLYVIAWVGAQLVGGLLGDVWRAISPISTLALGVEAIRGRLGQKPSGPPPWLGHWPAAAGLLVFLFYELIHPSGSAPRTLAWMLVVHTAVCLALAARWGAAWIRDHEPFAALFSLLAAMSVVSTGGGRQQLRLRAPMTGLARLQCDYSTLAVLLVVLGGTTFDGFSESEAGRSVLGRPVGWGGAVPLTAGLLVSIALVAVLFAIGIWWTRQVTGLGWREASNAFTPSLVPIVFGYAIAHYAQLLVDESQTFVFQLSDPAGLGWNLFGGADGRVNFDLISVDLVAWIQVLSILFGHLGAVAVAHDRSVELFSAGQSLRCQFAMLLVMVAYSTLGLWLLLNA